ncbi:MAG TPA: CopD family protein [Chthoniobacteraceae bacterium]|nr:CopD family protein [Chthoniobacteraceae bacterium]
MEHAALHALLYIGLIVAMGGPVAMLWLFAPSARLAENATQRDVLLRSLETSVTRWTVCGALAAAFAMFADFFVAVAELNGRTIFGGADLSEVQRFAFHTTVGRLGAATLALLLLTAGAALLRGTWRWWLVGALAFASIALTGDVSHAAALPGRSPVPVGAQIAHITAAALWMGVLLHIFFARRFLLATPEGRPVAMLATVVGRFSPLALATTALLGITGIVAAWRYLYGPDMVIHSPYGLTLFVKLALLTPAIYAGFINFRRIGPALARLAGEKAATGSAEARGVFSRFSRTLELEVTAGLLVITVAGILGSVSPPGEDGSYRLTDAQARVFLKPHLPQTNIAGWELPDDPLTPAPHELRYAEFTHNWSGLMVCLMGAAWLALSAGGNAAKWAQRAFPLVLLLFGMFIALAANPDLWILHRYTILGAIADPILFEHQLGGIIVFILAWLTWRDRKTPAEKQPLGYPLPVIMIIGSLLLLGHAHTVASVPDDLTNLINTQHAVFGSLGLFAGTTRLLMLRGLVPARAARFVWPSFVFALGVYMAFFYRELV